MSETTTDRVDGRIDGSIGRMSLQQKAALVSDPGFWTTPSSDRRRLQEELGSQDGDSGRTDRCGTAVTVSDRALRKLYAAALDRAVAETANWMASVAASPRNRGVLVVRPGGGGAWASAIVAGVEHAVIDAAMLDAKVRRLLLLALRAGLLDPEVVEPLPHGAPQHGAEIDSIAVIGALAVRDRVPLDWPGVASPSTFAALSNALPEARLTYSLGATPSGDHGPAAVPVEQLTNPVTGRPGMHVRHLDAAGRVVRAEERRSSTLGIEPAPTVARIELTATWLPVECDRVRLGVVGGASAAMTVGGVVLIDADAAESAELSTTAGVPLELRLDVPVPLAGSEAVSIGLVCAPAEVDAGRLVRDAMAAAREAQVAVVVVGAEPDPRCQDDLVRAVSAANPITVVVVDADRPVPMPWSEDVAAVLFGADAKALLPDTLRRVTARANRVAA